MLAFDKDDSLSMRFVCAASNVRSRSFHIEAMSIHAAKGVAGNIIPAIATTNAIVAGLQVLAAMKLLKGESIVDAKLVCPHTYCLRLPTRKGLVLQPTAPEPPNTRCFVCGTDMLEVEIDTETATLQDLVTKVLKNKLGLNEPSITVGSSGIYEEGDDADEDLEANLPTVLCKLPGGGISNGSVVDVNDFSQDLDLKLSIVHKSVAVFEEEKNGDHYAVLGEADKAQRQACKKQKRESTEPIASSSSSTDAEEATASLVVDKDGCIALDGDDEKPKPSGSGDDAVVALDDVEVIVEKDDLPAAKRAKTS
jgi:ubiquitin-like 1-activating enzyme E1 B